jgi:hypothetical protein
MMKSMFFAATIATTALPNLAYAAPPKSSTFVHDGQTYVYTVEVKGDYRILRGKVEPTGEKFELRVSDKWVKGDVGGKPVSFSVASVKRRSPAVNIAAD